MKILILEDTPNHFRKIYESLEKEFGTAITIYPQTAVDKPENTITDYESFLENYVRESLFDEIINFYTEIDAFIIDINLVNIESDITGERFYNFLRSKNYREKKFKTIFISSHYSLDLSISEIEKKHVSMVWKRSPDYDTQICEKLKSYFPGVTSTHKGGKTETKGPTASAPDVSVIIPPPQVPTETAILRKVFWVFVGKEIKTWPRKLDNAMRWCIHILITLSFYALITAAVLFGTYQIGKSFWEYREIKAATETSGDHREEMRIFHPIENIFLFLLPIFVTIGFYIYYKINSSRYLLNEPSPVKEEEKSTKAMTLTKMMFISSIISFVLIKCIEQIFIDPQKTEFVTVAGGSIFLVILMGFFIKMYGKNH